MVKKQVWKLIIIIIIISAEKRPLLDMSRTPWTDRFGGNSSCYVGYLGSSDEDLLISDSITQRFVLSIALWVTLILFTRPIVVNHVSEP